MSISNLAEIAALGMTQIITIKPYLGTTGGGIRSYGPAKTYLCRVKEDQKPIFTTTGQQVVSTSTVEVFPRATDGTELTVVNVDSQIVLPDGTSPRLLRTGSVDDFDGNPIFWRILT